jgi:hypothetical protein
MKLKEKLPGYVMTRTGQSLHRLAVVFPVIVCLLMMGTSARAQEIRETLSTTYLFHTPAGVTLHINNKYGEVKVNTWQKDSVKVEVRRTFIHSNRDQIEKLKNEIDISHSVASNLIRFETTFQQSGKRIFRNIQEATNMVGNERNSRIEYAVTVPARTNISIVNKYGDVILPNLSGKVSVDLSNGNLQVRKLSGSVNLVLAFGVAIIDELTTANLDLNFVELSLNKANNLTIRGNSSTIDIPEINTLELDSRRDKIKIGKVASISGTTYFSNIRTEHVTSYVNLTLTYGEISKLNLSSQVTECIIVARTCNITLEIDRPMPYSILLKHHKGNLMLPETIKKSDQKFSDPELSRYYFRNDLSESKLKMNIYDADLKIIHK